MQRLDPSPPEPGLSPAQALASAEHELQIALRDGFDTGTARAAVAAAQAQIEQQAALDRKASADAAAADAGAALDAESALVTQAIAGVGDSITAMAPLADREASPEPGGHPFVAAAAIELARAQAALSKAFEPQRKLGVERDALRARLSTKETASAALKARRAAGDERSGDAAELHLLAQDVEGLQKLLEPVMAELLRIEPVAEQHRVDEARQGLAAATRKAELEGMADRVRAAECRLVELVRALRLAANKRGVSNLGSVFLPSDALRKVANGAWL